MDVVFRHGLRWAQCWILALGLAPAWLHAAEFQYTIERQGRRIDLPVHAKWVPSADRSLHLQLDLDLQPLLTELRAEFLQRLPHERCQRGRRERWLAFLNGWSARVQEDRLELDAGVDVELHACLRWRDLALERRVGDGRVQLGLALVAAAEDGQLRIRALRPRLRGGGALGDALDLLALLRGEELNERAAELLEDWNRRQPAIALPSTLVEGHLTAAHFVDAGRPTLRLLVALKPQTPSWLRWLARKAGG